MNGLGNEIAKSAGRAMMYGILTLVVIAVVAFLVGRYSA